MSYSLSFAVPASTSSPVTGSSVISFTLRGAASELALDFMPPPGTTVTVRAGDRPLAVEYRDEHLLLPASALKEGRNELSFAFTANDGPLNRRPDLVYTLLVPARARELFPCFDQPDLKARFALSLALPPSWTAAANGAAEAGTGFTRTEPLATYQFAFAAGPWTVLSAEKDGRRYRLFHRESDPARAAAGAAAVFAAAHKARLWMEEYTGIPQPYSKLDMVAVPGFQYGGMEHPGALYLNSRRVFLGPDATEDDRLKRASLVAHEVAHLWFGDLVTMRWFDDVWLKEVFANFFADKIVAPDFPDSDPDLRAFLAHAPDAYEADRSPEGSNPVLQPLENMAGAGALYGPIVYHKAPAVMRQLEARLGPAALRAGLRDYLTRHLWGNASWADLVAALAPHDKGGLAGWARLWVEETGRPRVAFGWGPGEDGRNLRLSLRQEDPEGKGRTWAQLLEPVVRIRPGILRFRTSMTGPEAEVTSAAAGEPPLWALPDRNGLAYARVVLDPATRADFLKGGPDPVLEPAARAVAWVSLWEDVRDGTLAPEDFLTALMVGLPKEPKELLAARLLKWLKELGDRWLAPARRAARAQDIEFLLHRELEHAGTASLKKEYFRALSHAALTDDTVDWLERVWRREDAVAGLTLDDEDETALAFELALRRPGTAAALLDAQAARLKDPDRRARFDLIRPAASPEAADRRAFFASLRTPEGRRKEAWVEDALRLLNHPLRAAASLELLPEALELLPEVKRTGDIFFPAAWLEASLSGHGSPAAAKVARDFLDRADRGEIRLDWRLRALCARLFDPVLAAARARHH